jgi:hypothetical protein
MKPDSLTVDTFFSFVIVSWKPPASECISLVKGNFQIQAWLKLPTIVRINGDAQV